MMEQGTDEWFAARLGKVTASRVSDVVAKTKTGWGALRATYMAQLIVERLTGEPTESYSTPAMQWGIETEARARAEYEFSTDAPVMNVGFVDHPMIAMAGASPDGLVGKTGLLEIKCPNTATHIDTYLSQTVPTRYIPQMQFQMACTDRQWCDFVSFDPRMPEHARLFVRRVHRDNAYIDELEAAVAEFLAEVESKVERIRKPAEALT